MMDPHVATTFSETGHGPGFWRRLLKRPLAVVCIAYLLVLSCVAIFAPIFLPHVSHEGVGDLLRVRARPSVRNLLGTDTLGRDVLNRLLVGARPTMIGVLEAVAVGTILGVPLGLAAGYLRGRFDRGVVWLIDLALSTPALIVVLVVISVLPRNMLAAMVTIGVLSAPSVARIVRGVVLPVREELYIAAAQVSGLSRPYIIGRHVLPRVAGVVIVQTALFAAGAVGITGGLAYLGVLSQSVPTWGAMIQDGITVLRVDPWLILPPGIAIGLTVLAFTLLGDAVRDATAEAWAAPVARKRDRQYRKADRRQLAAADPSALLSVERLTVSLPSHNGDRMPIVQDLTFQINEGETVGIVGESGCGKTMTAMAILGILPGGGRIESGGIFYGGRNLPTLSDRDVARIRGKKIALISQEPMVSLTPTFRVGWQIAQLVRHHQGVSRPAARARAIELLRQVKLPEPEFIARRYVHELSGGMAQRVAIARALAGDPKLLIADEPTTALDVTVQAEILELLRELKRSRKMSILLISHDWGVVADLCDRAVVMYAGEAVESAAIVPIFHQPLHPYTEALLDSNPHHAPGSDQLHAIQGAVPRPGAWPEGCHFHPRCTYATHACREAPISLQHPAPGRETRCIHYDRLLASAGRQTLEVR
jgi:peptide/nickel transport system permease protein